MKNSLLLVFPDAYAANVTPDMSIMQPRNARDRYESSSEWFGPWKKIKENDER